MKFPTVKNKVKFLHSVAYLRKHGATVEQLLSIFLNICIKRYIETSLGGFTGNIKQLEPFLSENEIIKLQNALNSIIYKYGLKLPYKEYRKQVDLLTNSNYNKYKRLINPRKLKRGQYRYHIHHKFTVKDGFKNNVSLNIISHPNNLEMLWWKDNISISSKSSIALEELLILFAL